MREICDRRAFGQKFRVHAEPESRARELSRRVLAGRLHTSVTCLDNELSRVKSFGVARRRIALDAAEPH